MKSSLTYCDDIFGLMFSDYMRGIRKTYKVEREDRFTTDCEISRYFQTFEEWPALSKHVLCEVQGRILDIGAGAGRHSLYFQNSGYEVFAIENSPLAVEVMKRRNIRKVYLGNINNLPDLNFPFNSFNSVLLMFNNFGLGGSQAATVKWLKDLRSITASNAKIFSVGVDPSKTDNPKHIKYNEYLSKKKRIGRIKLLIKYNGFIGPWYYLFMVPPEKMAKIVAEAGWQIEKIIDSKNGKFGAIINKQERR